VSCLLGVSFNGSDFCYIFAIGSSLSIVANNQNNIVGWSERTSLEAVDTFSTTICFKTLQLCFLEQIASVRSETYFTLLRQSAMQNSAPFHVRFTTVKCRAIAV